METSRTNVEIWKSRFLRKYTASGVTDVTSLRTLSDEIAAEAGEMITINQTGMEAGSGAGILTGNKMEMLMAVEELLAATDPDAATAQQPLRSRWVSPDFRFCTP